MFALHALVIFVLLGVSALVLDVGVFTVEKRNVQNAVDGAALAAARELPGDPSAALAAAENYLALNGYPVAGSDVTLAYTTPYTADSEQVEVILTNHNVPYLFARVLGFVSLDISARAVGESVTGHEDDYAVFALDTSCGSPGIDIQGSDASFVGTVHGNSNVAIAGSDHSFIPSITFSCDFSEGGSGHTYAHDEKYTGERNDPFLGALIDFASFSCNFSYPNNVNLKSKAEVWSDAGKTQLISGVYCFDRNVSLVGNDITGSVTFVAMGNITVSGSNHNLSPAPDNDFLFYSESSTGPNQIDVSGSGGQWSGLMYAPNGDASLSGQANHNFAGSVVAQNVSINGNGMTIVASSLVSNGNPVVRLAE